VSEPTSVSTSAKAQFSDVIRRLYARRHLTTAITGLVRSVGTPATVQRPVLNAAALAVAGAQTAWHLFRMDVERVDDDRVAWADAAAGAATTLLGATALTQPTWTRGMAWVSQHTYWSATGTGLFGTSTSRPARLGLLVLPLLVPVANRRALERIRPGLATGFLGAGAIGLFLSHRLNQTSREIDELVEQTTLAQTSVIRQQVNSEIELNVVAVTVERLQKLRDLMVTDRDAAKALADKEVERLRNWLAEDAEPQSMRREQTTAVELAARTDAVARLDRAVRIFDAALRLVVLVQVVQEVGRGRQVYGPARSETAMAALAAAHYGLALFCLADGSAAAKAGLGAADVAMNLVNSVLEPHSADGSGRPQWSMGYAVGLAAASGVTGAGTGQPPVAPAIMGATRGLFELGRAGGNPLSRTMRALDEATMLVDVAMVTRQSSDLTIDQSTAISTRAAELTEARVQEASVTARRDHEYFLHDSALQVFLWATKPDLETAELLAWLDRELERLDGLLDGSDTAPATDLVQAVTDLLSGFELLGVHAQLTVPNAGPQRSFEPATALFVVTALNEALTNVLKHSTDRTPRVTLTLGDDIVCRVENDFPADSSRLPTSRGAGLGLRSLKARAASSRGRVIVLQPEGRFIVEVTVPNESTTV